MISDVQPIDLSFEEIFETYHDRIYRYIHRMVFQSEIAEEITQETFLRVHQRLNTLQHPQAICVWLYRIATNLCHDEWRKQGAGKQEHIESDEILEFAVDDSRLSLDVVIDQNEMSDCIQRYITRLSDDYRLVILLHDLNNLTCAEIAEMLDSTPGSIKIRLNRARLKLRTSLADACHFSNNTQGIFICDPKTKEC